VGAEAEGHVVAGDVEGVGGGLVVAGAEGPRGAVPGDQGDDDALALTDEPISVSLVATRRGSVETTLQ
jgi:hypothetical protein